MANGRPTKQPDYCDYQFEDGTYCKEKISGNFLLENGKPVNKTNWRGTGQQKYCLFHSHNDDDKVGFFYPEIKNRINNANDSVKKKLEELDGKQLTDEEKVKREVKIRNENPLDFEGFYFPKKADFNNTIFEVGINLNKAEFSKEASFLYSKFRGKVYFSSTKFGLETSFFWSNFNGEVTFYYAEFGGKVIFDFAEFNNEVSFEFVKFSGEALFNDVKFGGETIFENSKFIGEASFFNDEFVKEVRFNDAKFEKNVNFSVKKISGAVYFFSTEFKEEVDFSWAEFDGETDFSDVMFLGKVDFRVTIFKKEVNFINAKFNGAADFSSAIFMESAHFRDTNFSKSLDFTKTAFLKGKLDFTRARFIAKETYFHNTIFNCEALFREQMLKGVRFTGCYLGSSSFYGSDVRDAIFINSSWHKSFIERQIEKLSILKEIVGAIPLHSIKQKHPRSRRRTILLDEKIYKSHKKTKNHEKKSELSGNELHPLYLEHLYCQFKLAMDRNKMYSLANDFYYGERLMEMKRLWQERSFWSILKSTFLWFYQRLAGFGNSPWSAIISLILILFTFSGLLIKFDGLTALNIKEANERCPCERNETNSAAVNKQNLKTPAAPAKASKSYISMLVYNSLAPLNAFNQSVKQPQSAKAPVKVPQKKEAGYSLKRNYLCNVFHVSLWNLTASPGRKSGDYKENSILAYLAVFFIQYVFRPLMAALIIISVRRKVDRG